MSVQVATQCSKCYGGRGVLSIVLNVATEPVSNSRGRWFHGVSPATEKDGCVFHFLSDY